MQAIKGRPGGRDPQAGGLAARFTQRQATGLLEGALRALQPHGLGEGVLELARLPGTFGILVAAVERLARGGVGPPVAGGAVTRGEAPHFACLAPALASPLAERAVRPRWAAGIASLKVNGTGQAAAPAGARSGTKEGCHGGGPGAGGGAAPAPGVT